MSSDQALPDSVPNIKGSIIGPTKDWIIKVYGRELWDKSVASLPKDDAQLFKPDILSVSWYSLESWGRLADALRREVRAKTGEDEATFDRRVVFEAGNQTITKIYRVVLGLFDATTIVSRVVPIFRRVYSHGTVDVVENSMGNCVLRFSHIPWGAMLNDVKRNFPLAAELVLDMAGQRIVEKQVSQQAVGKAFAIELRIQYAKKK
jgi:hypothetical protein